MWKDEIELKLAILFLVVLVMVILMFHCYRWIKTRQKTKLEDLTLLKPDSRTPTSKHCPHTWKVNDFYLENLVFKSSEGKDVWRARLKNSFQRVNVQLIPGCDCVVVHKWTLNLVSAAKVSGKPKQGIDFV